VEKNGDIKIDESKVSSADNTATNGVVHIIDAVLLPGPLPPLTQTIVDLAVATPELSTLVVALTAADLVDTLSGDGPFTVFAPSNDAFDALPAGVLDDLLKPTNKKALVDLLTYHVVAGNVSSDKIFDGEQLETVEKKYVTFRVSGKKIMVNSSLVTAADNTASNGVVHIVDTVLTVPDSVKAALRGTAVQ